jgi:RimJ/RimL family protein N-acetyltransferase
MVGDLCFVGEPDSEGEVEIGYGVYEEFRKRGFMTEAVAGIIKWSEKQPDIRSIVASTEKSNIDSYSILERNDFIKSGETESLFNWKLKLDDKKQLESPRGQSEFFAKI